MNENENKYLSLKDAAGLYGYTRDHLGLMIRQGKLKGIKLGSYYVTTNEWITDYLKDYANPTHPAAASKFSNKFLTQVFEAKENISFQSDVKGITDVNGITKETRNKMPQTDVRNKTDIQNKSENNFFSEIQKELLPSIKELSAAREKTDILSASPDLRHTISDNPYVILPIRKMEESECEEILRKISDRNE